MSVETKAIENMPISSGVNTREITMTEINVKNSTQYREKNDNSIVGRNLLEAGCLFGISLRFFEWRIAKYAREQRTQNSIEEL